ncbi:MAG TPA: hypothetical protein IAC21_06680 [Candidatus Enterenecus merdae]|nr:hypothetical protein [Candidatus Enterenecus merdae]
MICELIIANKRSGKMWDVTNSTTTVSYTTERTGSPGKLTFTVIKGGDLDFLEGDIVRFSVDGTLVFYGWVFTKSKDRWGLIEVTCYDRIRYLKANASYAFYGQTADQIIAQIAADRQIATSVLASTGYQIPSLVETDQSCLDIIQGVLETTLLNTGTIYVLYDDGNGLALSRPEDMQYPVMVGDKSLLTDYTYKTDIDEQTYNSIKLVRPNEETGRADVVVVEDSANIGQWGLLQLYQQVDGDVNTAQMTEQAKATLAYYNRRMRTLKVQSLGIVGVRAGGMIRMKVQGLGDINLDQWVLLEKVTHTFENDVHTMEFETLEI